MKLKKLFAKILLLVVFTTSILNISYASTAENLANLNNNIHSKAAVVIEETTGKVIYNKNAYERNYPASTTKILTAIIAIEECNLDETAVASEYAITSIPSGYTDANIQIGESLSIKDLLYAMMVKSANEAAVIIAEHISGNVDEFSKLMNKKAEEIGCKDSHFVNPNGVHDENHYSTAYDMAIIAQYCMKNETFRKIVSTTSYTLPATNMYESNDRTFSNSNTLIIKNNNAREDNYYYPYATGIKTGYTSSAQNCLVASAEKNGMKFISVVLGATLTDEGLSERYLDTINLFEYSFDNYSFQKVKDKGNFIETVSIDNASSDTKNLEIAIDDNIIALTSLDVNISELNPEIILDEDLKAPIEIGDTVGKIKYEIEGITYEADLVAKSEVKKKTYIGYIIYGIIAIIIAGVVIVNYNIKRKKRIQRINYKNNF